MVLVKGIVVGTVRGYNLLLFVTERPVATCSMPALTPSHFCAVPHAKSGEGWRYVDAVLFPANLGTYISPRYSMG